MSVKEYSAVSLAGKLCYFTSGKSFELPVRDFLNECRSGYKKEPSYETGTYNYFSSCNQRSLVSATRKGYSYILFVTKYHGLLEKYFGKYFISGMYRIGSTGIVFGRVFVKAAEMAFTSIEDAWEITPERWKQICPLSTKNELTNLRRCTQIIRGDLLDEIVSSLRAKNVIDRYLQEIATVRNFE